ncbi:MAG: hypothetical protein M1825_002014 [Sarcosagium campestre]|nr:MAG: hypothetical protein M1825_002014 [Sarcosagium campestre]
MSSRDSDDPAKNVKVQSFLDKMMQQNLQAFTLSTPSNALTPPTDQPETQQLELGDSGMEATSIVSMHEILPLTDVTNKPEAPLVEIDSISSPVKDARKQTSLAEVGTIDGPFGEGRVERLRDYWPATWQSDKERRPRPPKSTKENAVLVELGTNNGSEASSSQQTIRGRTRSVKTLGVNSGLASINRTENFSTQVVVHPQTFISRQIQAQRKLAAMPSSDYVPILQGVQPAATSTVRRVQTQSLAKGISSNAPLISFEGMSLESSVANRGAAKQTPPISSVPHSVPHVPHKLPQTEAASELVDSKTATELQPKTSRIPLGPPLTSSALLNSEPLRARRIYSSTVQPAPAIQASKLETMKVEAKTEDVWSSEDAPVRTWPKPAPRAATTHRVRKVIVRNIPFNFTVTKVLSYVFGGHLEAIIYNPPHPTATIYFLRHDECMRYYHETSNGIVVPELRGPNGKDYTLFVDLGKETDIVGSVLKELIDSGATRCVRAVDADEHWTQAELEKIAGLRGRRVEGVEITRTQSGRRIVTFRFCNVQDGSRFKGALERDVEWEHCNIHYAPDPCARASLARS